MPDEPKPTPFAPRPGAPGTPLALLLSGFPPAEAAAIGDRCARDGLDVRLATLDDGDRLAASLRDPHHAALVFGDGSDGSLATLRRDAPGMPVVAVLPAGVAPPDPEPDDWIEYRSLRRLVPSLHEAVARERRHRLLALIRGLTHELSNFLAPGQLVLDLATVGGRPEAADWSVVHEGIRRSLDLSKWIARLAAAPLSGRLPIPGGPLLAAVAAELRQRPERPVVVTDYPRGLPPVSADPVLLHRVLWCLGLRLLDSRERWAEERPELRLASRLDGDHLALAVTRGAREGEGAGEAHPLAGEKVAGPLAAAVAAAGAVLEPASGELRCRLERDG